MRYQLVKSTVALLKDKSARSHAGKKCHQKQHCLGTYAGLLSQVQIDSPVVPHRANRRVKVPAYLGFYAPFNTPCGGPRCADTYWGCQQLPVFETRRQCREGRYVRQFRLLGPHGWLRLRGGEIPRWCCVSSRAVGFTVP